jgi:hypothetical protein
MNFARGRATALLVNAAGDPVLPIADERTLDHVRATAELFGHVLVEEASPTEIEAPRGASGGAIAVLGDVDPALARLYAHLTGRRFVHVAGVSELEAASELEVCMLPFAAIDVAVVLALQHGGRVRGLLPLLDGDDAVRQLLSWSVARHPLGSHRDLLMYPEMTIGEVDAGGALLLGSRAKAGRVRKLLAEASGVVATVTHSDGLDSPLAGGTVTCALAASPRIAEEASSAPSATDVPRCVRTGTCHRLSVPTSEVTAHPKFVDASTISARVLVWDVCFGIMSSGGPVNPRWGIHRALLASPRVGAFLTNIGVSYRSFPVLNETFADLRAGASVAEAATRANQTPEAERLRRFFCVVGDPEARAVAPSGPRPAAESVPDDPTRRTSVSFLRTMLAAYAGSNDVSLATAAWPVFNAIQSVGAQAWNPLMAEAVQRFLQDALMSFFGVKGAGHWTGLWMEFTAGTTAGPSLACAGCGRGDVIDSAVHDLGSVASGTRTLLRCWHCGAVDDLATNDGPRLTQTGPSTFGWVGSRPTSGWSAQLVVSRSDGKERKLFGPWPSDPDGRPAEAYEVKEPLLESPALVMLVVLEGLSVHLSVRNLRG